MICLLADAELACSASLREDLEAALAPLPVYSFLLDAGETVGDAVTPEARALTRFHLDQLLPHVEVGILGSLPDAALLEYLLLRDIAWIAPDTPEMRARYGIGVHYVPALEPEGLAAAVQLLLGDLSTREAVVRKGRAQARRLSRLGASSSADAVGGLPETALVERPCLPEAPLPKRPRGGPSKLPPSLLAIVLTDAAEGLAVTLDALQGASPLAPAHLVVVLRTADPEVESQVCAVSAGRAEVIQPGPPYRQGRLVNAGLGARRPTDDLVLWLENGTGLAPSSALADLRAQLEAHGWACAAPGGRPRTGGETGTYLPPTLAQAAAPGTLWRLDELERLGGLAEALDGPLAEVDLYLRMLRTGGRGGLDVRMRRQLLPENPGEDEDLPLCCGLVTPALELGGAERWIVSLLQSTDTRIAWQGVALTLPHRFHPQIRAEVERCCPVLLGEDGLRKLASVCRVLVFWGVEPWRTLLPESYRGAVVLVSHGADIWTAELFGGSEAADALVAVSQVALQPVAAGERSRARVIPNAVAPARVVASRSREEVRASWGVASDARVLGLVARFTAEKDPLAVARAVRYLPPEWVGVMVGWVNDLPALQRQAEAIAPGRLRWPGPTDDVGSALGAMDTLLVASAEEGFCYALAEAWLAGVPTVSTWVGIAHEFPHLIREIPRDAHGAAIAGAILSDIADAEGTTARVARARAVAQTELSPERFGRRWSGALLSAGGANPWGDGQRLPGIQVVITGYNVEPWLERCLTSVETALAGTHWALLLADDGSTDRTWDLLRAHRSQAAVVRRKRFPKAANAGQAKNRALGLGLSLGKEYPAILFMDADDEMPRERVTHLLRGAVEGAHCLVHGALRFNAAVHDVEAGLIVHPTEDQHHRLSICPPAMVVHESLVPPDGRLFCEDLDAMEDGELLCRWELAGIVSVPLPGPVIHEYWPRAGSVMWNECLAENQRRFWERVGELRRGRRPLRLAHLGRD